MWAFSPVLHMSGQPSGWRLSCSALLLGLTLAAASAQAAPRTPVDDSEVLEALPFRLGNNNEISQRWAQWQANSHDLDNAAALARLYINQGRQQSDPRYYGYAEAVLQPWWQHTEPPAEARLLRAIIYQHQHEYEKSLADLQSLVSATPQLSQAWITLAVVQMVRGDYPAANESCKGLASHVSLWYATLCRGQLLSLTGDAERGYRLLATLPDQLVSEQGELQQWVYTLLGETAWRMGHGQQAEQHFRQALRLPASDHYLLRVFSDLLIEQQRPLEVLELLQDQRGDDALLLRLAIASRDAGQTNETSRYRAMLEDRYQAARLRGSSLHARDEALYLLEFAGDKQRALQLAQSNWDMQKEPEDTLLLIRAAFANQDAAAAQPALQWLEHTRQQDKRLHVLLDAELERSAS